MDLTWEMIRGFVTLALAVPFLLFMFVVGGAIGSLVWIVTVGILAVFIGLGLRDLAKAYGTLRDPAVLRRALEPVPGARRDGVGVGADRSALPSVTEHTTFPLKARSDERAPTERADVE